MPGLLVAGRKAHAALCHKCTVSVKAGCWHTNLQIPRTPGGANGKGPSFAYAWQHNLPWREDKSSPGHEGQAWVLAVARYRAVPGEATDNDARQGQDDPLWKTGNRSI